MTSKINILPPHIANKIAAGEVVERPASVVKELVENALDAGADEITVILSQAGKELIQVIDNGSGMNEADVPLALERHATSKIKTVEDLDKILTLGFRGEALPSIASVSRMEIRTCTKDAPSGMAFEWEGGVLTHQAPLAMKCGTSIAVKTLFFNTPARRNFLRADSTEFNRILKWMKRFFLANPKVRFNLVHNGEELFNLSSGSLESRISQVMGSKFLDGLVSVEEDLGETRLYGFTSTPDRSRGNRDNQFLFLNRRAITNHSLSHAIAQGYGNLIEPGRHPQFILFLDITPEHVDVNVHPTKMEVRFANERAMFSMFMAAARRAVQQENATPKLSFQPNDKPLEIRLSFDEPPASSGNDTTNFPTSPKEHSTQLRMDYPPLPDTSQPVKTPPKMPATVLPNQENLWQVHQRYIFSQVSSGLVMIDQQTAHERVLYEKFLGYLENETPVAAQQLLFPQTLELTLEDFLVFSDIKEWLQKIGFILSELSGRTVVLEAIPSEVRQGREARILLDIFDFYHSNEGHKQSPQEKIAAAFASKNAIRPGEKLNAEAMSSLINQLFATREPYFSPYGKPVIVTLEIDELNRRFKRK